MTIEVESWPYNFPASEDYQKSEQRGNLSGRFLVYDRYVRYMQHISGETTFLLTRKQFAKSTEMNLNT